MENLQSISFFSSDDSFDKKQAWNTKMTERSTMRDVCVDFRERGRSYVADLTFIYHLQRMFETLRLWVPSLDISQFSFLQVVGSFIESDIRAHFCLQVQRKIFTICLVIFQYNISKNISICQCIDGNTLLKYFVKTFSCQDEASGSKQFASESRCNCCNCCNCCIFKIFAFPQLNGTKRFQTTATLQATCMFSFSLWTLVPGTRQWLPPNPNIFPSHSEWWDWPGRIRCKNAKAQRNCGENNSLGLAFRNICSCQLPRDVSNCHGLRTWLDFGVFGEKYKDTSFIKITSSWPWIARRNCQEYHQLPFVLLKSSAAEPEAITLVTKIWW